MAIFNVPNNQEGKVFLALMKKYLNRKDYSRVRVRGRGKNRREKAEAIGKRLNFTHDMPIACADYFGIYLDRRYHTQYL